MDLSNENMVHIHKEGVEYLQFIRLFNIYSSFQPTRWMIVSNSAFIDPQKQCGLVKRT